jgi:hypothetical protein
MASASDLFAQALQDYKRPGASPAGALADFDPSAALQKYGAAAAGDFNKQLGRSVSDLKGSAVGAGRLNTGFYDQDTGRLTEDLAGQYQRDLAQQSVTASGQKLSALNSSTGYAEEEQNRYLDMLSGQEDRDTAAANAKRASQSAVWGAVGDIAGAGIGLLASSERFKDDVEPIEGASDRLRRVGGKSFRWKDSGEPDVGVLAEDVADAVPEASHRDERGRPDAVHYGKLLPVAIQAINEQGDELDELRRSLGSRRRAA